VTLSKYIGDKTQMNHELEKLRSEQEETLHLLASQLKEKFSRMEQRIAKQTVNESCRSDVDDLLTKYRQLEQNNTDLRTNFKTLQKKYNEQQAEMMVLKNKTYLLEHKLAALEQLKSVNQLQSLVTLQKKVQTMDSSVMSLLRQEKARDQDFLALYNITTQSRSQLGDFERRTLVEFQYLEGQQNNTISVLHKYGTQIHENNIQGI
jgi:hypothetical protein